MRFNGTLTKWNEEKGFGFITPSGGGKDLFVHISEFPKTKRPTVGNPLIFQIKEGADGRRKAISIEYFSPKSTSSTSNSPQKTNHNPSFTKSKRSSRFRSFITSAAVITVVYFVANAYFKTQTPSVQPTATLTDSASPEPTPRRFTSGYSNGFRCDDRKYCSQMTSCAEATFFTQNCPGTKMDGNHDGIPCETQWCK